MFNERKELESFNVEKETLDLKTEVYKNHMVENLTSGNLGKDIRSTLNNPVRITKFQMFKIRLGNFLKNLFEVL